MSCLDFICSTVGNWAVEAIKEYVVAPMIRHIGYPFTYKTNLAKLGTKVGELRDKRDKLQQSVDQATLRGDEIQPGVLEWLKDADVAIEKDQGDCTTEQDDATYYCCNVLIPNLKKRYQLSKNASMETSAIADIMQRKCGSEQSQISYRPVLRQIVGPSVPEDENVNSRSSILNQVLDAIKDPNVNMVGVYGIGGVGKTTLAKEVQTRLIDDDRSFDLVFFTTVTATPDLDGIRQQIADMLGLEFSEKTAETKASRLHQTLEKKKQILIILDDIWEEIPLQTVGIPSPKNHENCKILVTSRDLDVLHNKMCTQIEFRLETLEEGEAWSLFQNTVGEIQNDEELSSVAKQVANKCAGLPLLIVSVAKALKGKTLPVWNSALTELSRVDNKGEKEKVFKAMQLSYDHLADDGIRSFFLLCGQVGRPIISIEDLLKYSTGLHLLKDEKTVEDKRNKVLKWINTLKDSCLLLDSDNDKMIEIHDLVRDAALSISIASQVQVLTNRSDKDALLQWPTENELKECKRICLPYCKTDELPIVLNCQEVELFILGGQGRYSFLIPEKFFELSKKLRVLHLFKISFGSTIPTSLCSLTNLRTLSLEKCSFSGAPSIGNLKTLEILSFKKSSMEQLPREVEQLTQLKVLDLSGCWYLKCIPPNVLSSLTLLEELYVDSFYEWDFETNASITELERLDNLTSLEILILHMEKLPMHLSSNLKKFKIICEDTYGEWPTHWHVKRSRTLKLNVPKGFHCESWLKMLLKETEDLTLSLSEGFKDVLHDLQWEAFPRLKHLNLQYGREFSYILNSLDRISGQAFTKLESLSLSKMESLKKICHGDIAMGTFSNLTTLEVSSCPKLKNLFSVSMVRSILKLQKLEVCDCDNLEEIVSQERNEDEEILKFTDLRFLRLKRLPRIRFFFGVKMATEFEDTESGLDPPSLFNAMVEFPELEEIQILRMQNMERIWNGQLAKGSFAKLKSVQIRWCERLETVFPFNVLRTFQRLEKLKVTACGSLQEIYQVQEELIIEETSPVDAFELREMVIGNLRKLKHIWSKDPQGAISFQKLKSVQVEDCPVLENLFPASIAKDLLQIEKIDIQNCGIEEIVAKAGTEVGSSPVKFPRLTSLEVYELPKLRSMFPESLALHLTQLQKLRIRCCKIMKEVIQSEGAEGTITFHSLNTVELGDLPMLSSFYSGSSNMKCPSLKGISIEKCPSMKIFISTISRINDDIRQEEASTGNMPPFFSHLVLPNVEQLSLDSNATEILLQSQLSREFLSQIQILELGFSELKSTLCLLRFLKGFPKLRHLILQDSRVSLRRRGVDERQLEIFSVKIFKHLWKQVSQLETFLQNLEILHVSVCSEMKNLIPSTASFLYLTTLEVQNCDDLIKLVTSSTAKSMVRLVTMTVSNCEKLTEIISSKKDGTMEEITFSRLKNLRLCGLRKLENFCSGSHAFNFPCLEQVTVDNCPKMRIFCHGNLTAPKLKRVKLSEFSEENKNGTPAWYWKGDLNATVSYMFMEMVGFDKYPKFLDPFCLNLSEYPQLIEKQPNCLLSSKMKSVLGYARRLEVDNCTSISNAISQNVLKSLKSLRKLTVRNCDSVEQIFDLEGLTVDQRDARLVSVPCVLELVDLPRLRRIRNHDPQGILSFESLTHLEVHNCISLTSVFNMSIALCLNQLWTLEVKGCSLVEQILAIEEEEEALRDEAIFPMLHTISLEDLPGLTRFCSGSSVINCLSLNRITLVNCPHMKILDSRVNFAVQNEGVETIIKGASNNPIIHIFNGQIAIERLVELNVDWQSLKEVWDQNLGGNFFNEIHDVGLMGFSVEDALLPSDFLEKLPNLKKLVISNADCEEISLHEIGVSEKNYLISLTLSHLPKLKHLAGEVSVSPQNRVFELLECLEVFECEMLKVLLPSSISFQNLTRIKVSKCNGLVTLMTSSAARSLVQLKEVEITGCKTLEEIVAREANGAEDEIVFNKLEKLKLKFLPFLVSFCSGKNAFNFPSLVKMKLDECPNLKYFTRGAVSANSLWSMRIYECPNMKYFTRGTVSVQQLKGIWISENLECEGSIHSIIEEFVAK